MSTHKKIFLNALSKEISDQIPLYCTGYPEIEFIENYAKQYYITSNQSDLVLYKKNYDVIEQMGFDAISLWDFRREKGGYNLDAHRKVDGWGRIYKGDWYTWDGVFKSEKILESWEHLKLPSNNKLKTLRNFLNKSNQLEHAISLPGLFEKTWQSMGLIQFSKNLKTNITLVESVISFFSDYLQKLINALQNIGAKIYLIADDVGYNKRTFIPKDIWRQLFFKKYQEIVNIIHEKNHKIILHSDGYISDFIETFVSLEFDAIQSLEANAGVDIFALFKKFRNQICFIGNLDITLLSFGTSLQVKQHVIKLIKKSMKYNCPLVISPTQQVNAKCKPENIKMMIETTKKQNS